MAALAHAADSASLPGSCYPVHAECGTLLEQPGRKCMQCM